jgi:3-methyladenine DNA glycosylase AlkD
MPMQYEQVRARLEELADPTQLEGQARFGIDVSNSLGIGMPALRDLAREAGRDHVLAQDLWSSGIREARILAAFVDDPSSVTEDQMEAWAGEFSSWEVVDACCCNLFDRTGYAYSKAIEWSRREEEFVKRAAFSLMACLAVHDKRAENRDFAEFFAAIEREACDGRNFVKKAVNWALRQIGKRNLELRAAAIEVAERVGRMDCRAAKWVASDALRELRNAQLETRLGARRHR